MVASFTGAAHSRCTGARAALRSRAVLVTLLAVLAATAVVPAPAAAQRYRISQRATVSQTLGATLVSLDYSRPLARGRSGLFGDVVIWGELWTPGANEATVLEASDTIELNGTQVPAGRWSMWVIPSQVGPWELVLDARDSLFHTQRPEPNDTQVVVPLKVKHGVAHTEALSWSFPRIAQDGATLRMSWGDTEIDLEVAVPSVAPALTISAADAAPYLGEWMVTFEHLPEMGGAPPPAVMTLRHEDDMLMASFPPGTFAPPPAAEEAAPDESGMTPQERERAEARRKLAALDSGDFSWVLVPRAEGVFMMGWVQDGLLYDVEEFFYEFALEGDRPVAITMRNSEDRVAARAERVHE